MILQFPEVPEIPTPVPCLGEALRVARRLRRLSGLRLAKLARVRVNLIYEIETGLGAARPRLAQIAAALGMTTADLERLAAAIHDWQKGLNAGCATAIEQIDNRRDVPAGSSLNF